jgi:hypothetical protein
MAQLRLTNAASTPPIEAIQNSYAVCLIFILPLDFIGK